MRTIQFSRGQYILARGKLVPKKSYAAVKPRKLDLTQDRFPVQRKGPLLGTYLSHNYLRRQKVYWAV